MRYSPSQIEWMEAQDETPKVLLDRPHLDQENVEVWRAFWFLHPGRPAGFDANAIPLTEIIAFWRDVAGVTDPDALEEKVYLIRVMDLAWLDEHQSRREKKRAAKGK